jgi:protein phosphatase 1 regulatory subunit 7
MSTDPSTAPTTPAPTTTVDLPKSNGARTAVVKQFSEDEHSGGEEGPAPELIDDDEDLLDDYPADVEELDLIHLRIKSIPALRLERFKKVMVYPPGDSGIDG